MKTLKLVVYDLRTNEVISKSEHSTKQQAKSFFDWLIKSHDYQSSTVCAELFHGSALICEFQIGKRNGVVQALTPFLGLRQPNGIRVTYADYPNSDASS